MPSRRRFRKKVDRFDSEALGWGPCGSDSESTLPNLPRSALAKVVDPGRAVRGVRGADGCARPSLQCIGNRLLLGEALLCRTPACRSPGGRPGLDWQVLRLWLGCCDLGPDVGFVLEAWCRDARRGGRRLVGERVVVHQLEVDILFALERPDAGVAAVWSSSTIRREQRLRARLEEIDEVTGLPNRHRFMRLLGSWLDTASDSVRIGLVVLTLEWVWPSSICQCRTRIGCVFDDRGRAARCGETG